MGYGLAVGILVFGYKRYDLSFLELISLFIREASYSDYIDFAINIGEEIGEQEFAIVFNFKDSLNQESSIRYPFTMIVEEQPVYEEPVYNEEEFYMPEVSEPMEEETGAISMTTWIIIGVAGAVVIAVVIIIIVVAVKKKKAKEEEDESI